MIHRQKNALLKLEFSRRFFERRVWTKSGHGYGQKHKPVNQGKDGGEEGKIRLLKSRGQHLLTNTRVLDSIVRVSDIKPDDTVLEIGPGTGNLTLKLLQAANHVVAVEIDNRMIDSLRKRAAAAGFEERLKIINGDALRTEFPKFNLVVANIPYGISSPLLAKLIYGVNTNPFRSATLLIQKEFARRLLAEPGDSEFNRLAVNMKLMAEVELVMDVSKRDFVPSPKVDSSLVMIYPKSEIPDVNLGEWWAFTRTCFNKKNKTLGATFKQKRKLMELMHFCRDSNHDVVDKDDDCSSDEDNECRSRPSLNLGTGLSSLRGKISCILESGGYMEKRPAKMSHEDLLHLLSLFNEAGIYFHDHEKSVVGACNGFQADFDSE